MKKFIVVLAIAMMSAFTLSAQTKTATTAKQVATTVFTTDIDCPHCSKKILNTIPYEKGVKDVQVDVPTKAVTVKYDPAKTNDETLKKALNKIDVKVTAIKKK